MSSYNDLLRKYEDLTNTQLYEVYLNRDLYTEEANKALDYLLNNKIDLETVKGDYLREKERERVIQEINVLIYNGAEIDEILNNISGDKLSNEDIEEITKERYNDYEESKDKYSKVETLAAVLLYAKISEDFIGFIKEDYFIFIISIALVIVYRELKKKLFRAIVKSFPKSVIAKFLIDYKIIRKDHYFFYIRALLTVFELTIVLLIIMALFVV